jgi:hypothetical protein
MSTLAVNTITNAAGGNTAQINGMTPTADSLQDRFNEVFEYRDGVLHWKVTLSNVAQAGKVAGCKSTNTYGSVMVDGTAHCIHRVIFCMHHGYMPEQVDHIDGNRKNNAIENLRPATNALNCLNKGAQSNNKLGVKNVCWSKQNKKWFVQVSVKGKRVVSKFFDDLDLADLVATMAREKYHGAFANHGNKGAQT